jgi:hypothetical protein
MTPSMDSIGRYSGPGGKSHLLPPQEVIGLNLDGPPRRNPVLRQSLAVGLSAGFGQVARVNDN